MRFLASLTSALGLLASHVTAATSDPVEDDPDVRSITLRTHSLSQPYLDSDMQSRWYDFGGDTIIRTDSYIRLTSDYQSQTGWLFSRVPLTATNWQIEVEFKIHGKNHLYGDGMAMWLTKSRGQQGPVFGNQDQFEGLGIFIDTYKNNRPGTVFPYVMAMMGDGQTFYDKGTDGKAQELAGCSARGLRNAQVPTKLKLTYFQDKYLKLDLQYKKEDEWQECFRVESPPTVPQVSYLGFTAETGELSDHHDIVAVKVQNLYVSPNGGGSGGSGGGKRRKNKKVSGGGGGGTWSGFLLKAGLLLLVVAGAYVGFATWRAKNRRSRF